MRICKVVRPEDLSAWADGEIDPRSARTIEDHVDRCPRCRAILAGWEEDRRALRRVFAGEPAGPGFDQGVMGALTPPEEISLRPPRWRVVGRVAAALLLLAILGALTRLGRESDRQEGDVASPPPTGESAETDPVEAYAKGETDDPEPCVRLLWDRGAEEPARRRAGEAIRRRIRARSPDTGERRTLAIRLVPLLHPDLDLVARSEAVRSLETLYGSARGYAIDAEPEACLEAIRRWYAELR